MSTARTSMPTFSHALNAVATAFNAHDIQCDLSCHVPSNLQGREATFGYTLAFLDQAFPVSCVLSTAIAQMINRKIWDDRSFAMCHKGYVLAAAWALGRRIRDY